MHQKYSRKEKEVIFSQNLIKICLTSVTRAKPKEKNEMCHSVLTHAVKCDGLFFVLQYGFQYVSLRLCVQNAGPAEPCVGKY